MSDERTEETNTESANVPAVRAMPEAMGAIAVRDDLGYIAPRTLEEAYDYARLAVHIAPDSYKGDLKKVTLAIMAGMEAGVAPLYALRNIAIINGVPTMYGDLLLALVQSKGVLKDQVVREIGPSFDPSLPVTDWPADYGYIVQLWRRGQDSPYKGEFTVADAKRQGLWLNTRKDPWIKSPKRMLLIRARTPPLRDGFADCLAGLAVREEVEDYAPEEIKAIDTGFLADDPEPEVASDQKPG